MISKDCEGNASNGFFSSDQYRVVGFEVEPKSIDSKRIKVEANGACSIEAGEALQKINSGWKQFSAIQLNRSIVLGENTITMTYEVEWIPSETRWASR